MRLFLAVPLPPDLAPPLERAVRALPRQRWRAVPADRRHLTLQFLGERDPGDVPAILSAAAAAAAGRPAFDLVIAGLGAFPRAARPEVVFAGCAEGGGALSALASAIGARLAAAGLPEPDRAPHPHATLARRRAGGPAGAAAADLAALLEAAAAARWGRMAVAAVTLFRSDLRPSGPAYTALGQVPLPPLAGGPHAEIP